MFRIYKITSMDTGKSYVGMTSRSVKSRFNSHLSDTRQGSKFRFHSAIRKYGPDRWIIETLEEHKNIEDVRKREEEIIAELDLVNVGYNAKPGGCGGWIVPPEKFEEWKKKISKASTGLGNGNASKYTNEDLKEKLIEASIKLSRVPSSPKEARNLIQGFPLHFVKFRYDGKYSNLANIVKEITGLPYYNRSNKSPEHIEKIGLTLKGKTKKRNK